MSAEPSGSLTSGVPHQGAVKGACAGGVARLDGQPPSQSGADVGVAASSRDLAMARVLPIRDLVAIVLAGAGALFVFVSLLVDWQRVAVPGAMAVRVGIADIPTWGTVYVLCSMALIAVFVCVVALPAALGVTARVLGISWAMGVAGIIVAMLVRLTDTPAVTDGTIMRSLLDLASGTTTVRVSWGAGIVDAAVAVAMLMGAFITACPPLRARENHPGPSIASR